MIQSAGSAGFGYWRQHRSLPAQPLPDAVDVVVIGAGFTGLSIADDLLTAAPGLRLCVLEAQHVGYGASGRTVGVVSPLAAPLWLLPGSAGRDDAHELARILRDRIGALVGRLAIGHPGSEISPARMWMTASGALPAAALDQLGRLADRAGLPAAVRAAGPGETGLAGTRALLELPAWSLHPGRLLAALAETVTARGVSLHEGTPVTSVEPGGDAVTVRLADGAGRGATVHAGQVIVATNAFTADLALPDPPGGKVGSTSVLVSGELSEQTRAELGPADAAVGALAPGSPNRRLHGDRMLFAVGGRRRPDRELRRWVPAAAGCLTTAGPVAGAAVESAADAGWTGTHHTVAGRPCLIRRSTVTDRLVYAVGFGSGGLALSLAAGPLVRDLVLGPDAADQEAVRLRTAMLATRVPLGAALGALGGVLRGLRPAGNR